MATFQLNGHLVYQCSLSLFDLASPKTIVDNVFPSISQNWSSAHKWQGFNHLSLKTTRSSSSPSRAAWRMYGIRPGAQGTKGDTDKGPAALSFRQKGGPPKNTTSCPTTWDIPCLGIFRDFCWKKMGGGVCFLQGETPIWHSQILTQQLQGVKN